MTVYGLRKGLAFLLIGLNSAFLSGLGRSEPKAWSEPYLSYAYLRKAWENVGRAWVYKYSGVRWNPAAQKWESDEQWPYRGTAVGSQAYYVEYAARPAVNMGLVCHDVRLLDELAQFYTVYSNQFTTLGDMRRQGKSASLDTRPLERRGDDAARTLVWVEKQTSGARISECTLCNSQFLHPAARLMRVITLLPESERTPSMRNFVALYAPLIVRDHLIRLLYEAEWDHYGAQEIPKHQVEAWKAIAASSSRPKLSHQYAMLDTDLWLIATAAEILGANATDPKLVPLRSDEKMGLQQIVQTGVALFQKKRTFYPGTKNLRGEVVGSTSYFNGDLDDHPDNAYSGYAGSSFPTPEDKKVYRGASWDVSHFYRVPVFLRSLYDNKKASGVGFPSDHDVELLTDQLMYKVFRGDLAHPLFNNYFDGSNGWYRVGYHGGAFGYPPAQDCDAHSSDRPCATVLGAVFGWGLIASFNPDLMELQHALATLAWREDPQTKTFKDRYYWYNGQSYSSRNPQGQVQYPFLLFEILSAIPEKLQGCGPR